MSEFTQISEQGFYKPSLPDEVMGSEAMQLDRASLDAFVANGEGKKGVVGEVMRVVEWNSAQLMIAIFNPLTGQQVGRAVAQAIKDPMGRAMGIFTYETETVISTDYSRLGLASIASLYLQDFLRDQVPEDHTVFINSWIAANEEDAPAVEAMMKASGMKKMLSTRPEGPREIWVKELDQDSSQPIPARIFLSDLVLFPKEDEAELVLEEESPLRRDATQILFENEQVGTINDDNEIDLLPAKNLDSTRRHWEGAFALWQEGRRNGYRAYLKM